LRQRLPEAAGHGKARAARQLRGGRSWLSIVVTICCNAGTGLMNSHPSKQQLMRLAIKARIMPSAEDAKQFLRSVLFRLWWRIAPDSGHCYYPYGLLGASRYTARDAGSCPANASEVVANQRDNFLLRREEQNLMLYMDVPCSCVDLRGSWGVAVNFVKQQRINARSISRF
jgi:hypothetical protein